MSDVYFNVVVSADPMVLVLDEHSGRYHIDRNQGDCWAAITYLGEPVVKYRFQNYEGMRDWLILPEQARRAITQKSGTVIIASKDVWDRIFGAGGRSQYTITMLDHLNKTFAAAANGVKPGDVASDAAFTHVDRYDNWEDYFLKQLFDYKIFPGIEVETFGFNTLPKYGKVKKYVTKADDGWRLNDRPLVTSRAGKIALWYL